jgi:hypothetical protein
MEDSKWRKLGLELPKRGFIVESGIFRDCWHSLQLFSLVIGVLGMRSFEVVVVSLYKKKYDG